ncbi:MAG: hypothetical protein R2856_35815 [Caldilineaceae bacterium]
MVEMNAGQMLEDVKLALAGETPIDFLGRMGCHAAARGDSGGAAPPGLARAAQRTSSGRHQRLVHR